MAQTIAMQRGTAGSTSSNTQVTLFTQSSGIATRVICNQLLFGNLNSQISYPNAVVILQSASGYQTEIGYMIVQTGGFGWFKFAPTNAGGMYTAIGFSTTTTLQEGIIYNANYSSYGAANNVSLQVYEPSSGHRAYIPQTFWMGNGDSILFKCSSNVGYIGWNFTTITES